MNKALKYKTKDGKTYKVHKTDRGAYFIKVGKNKRYLSIEQICTNPFIVDSSLTEFKKSLQILAKNSHVLLYPQPLKYLMNPRYFIEFSQSLLSPLI